MVNPAPKGSMNFWVNLFKAPTEKEDLETVLKSMPPFEKLKSKYIDQIIELIHNRVYGVNEHLFLQGDPGIGLFIVREGEVLIKHTDEFGVSHNLAVFKRGDFFGEMALLEDDTRSASAIATKETSAAVIFKPDLDEFIDRNPAQGTKVLRGISKILALRLRLVNQEYFDLYQKVFQQNREKLSDGD
ncbi:MAG: cyclic nucleotide-binding domain-containing protein [Melioribacteraceae bacterium]|nr:cyclic nucleotide-binding domain-containing protein [Melioribacteraceae bacterium]